MAKTEVGRAAGRTSWRNPVLRFEAASRAPSEAVYDVLADLESHLEWAGRRQRETSSAPPTSTHRPWRSWPGTEEQGS